MDNLEKYCCQNQNCKDYGKRNGGNMSVSARYGKNKEHLYLYCSTCKKRFSARKGTPLFNSRLPQEKVVSILEHLAEGCGIRKTARLTKVDRKTVGRLNMLVGDHSQALHDELVAFSPENTRGSI